MVKKVVKVNVVRHFARPGSILLGVFLLAVPPVVKGQQRADDATARPLLASKETSTALVPSAAPKAVTTDYTVSPEDLLDVNVLDVPEVTRTYRVSSNGFLTLPLLTQPIPAAGETLDQLQRLIATKFREAGMLNNAVVTVSLKETRLHSVLVSGEVSHPAAVPIYGATHLLDVLIQAGGISGNAGDDVIITRGDAGRRADVAESAQPGAVARPGGSFTLDIRKLVQTGDDTTNVLLYPGDRVTVQRAQMIYILGAVNRPGGYVLNETRQQITVLKALAMAGDVNNVAKRGHITVLRRDPGGPPEKRTEIPVNYKGMVKGEVDDVKLIPDDILFVPESGGLKALHTSVGSAVSIATAGATTMMIYR